MAATPSRSRANVGTLRELQRGLDMVEGRLSARYAARDIPRVPVAQIDADWRRAEATFWPFSIFRRNKVRRTLSTYAQDKAGPLA